MMRGIESESEFGPGAFAEKGDEGVGSAHYNSPGFRHDNVSQGENVSTCVVLSESWTNTGPDGCGAWLPRSESPSGARLGELPTAAKQGLEMDRCVNEAC